nr:MAG TPA: spore cortex-lytic enzyme [Caudoviricetes sp.]
MRRRNNLYWLILAFIAVSLTIIFCAATLVIQDQSEKMEQQQEIEAVRLREKREAMIELTTLIYAEPRAYENPLADEENVKAIVLNHYEDTHMDVEEEPSYDGKGGLECEFKEDVERLACVIYQEAGGDACCGMCRKRVADVVLNRVKDPRFKGTTIEEILIDGDPAPQWGLYSVTGVVWPEKASYPEEAAAVQRAWDTAFDVLEGNHSDLTEDYIWCAEFPQGTDVIECCGIYFGK